MAPTRTRSSISYEQYCALQDPVKFPTPEQQFVEMLERLEAAFAGTNILTRAHADAFRCNISDELTGQLFLIVPPQPPTLFQDAGMLNDILARLEVDGKRAMHGLDLPLIKDVGEVHPGPSLLLGVRDGREFRGVKPSVSAQTIGAANRHPFRVWMGIVYAMAYPDHLFRGPNNLQFLGSIYRHNENGLGLCLDEDGGPKLIGGLEDCAHEDWGTPSYGDCLSIF